MENFTITGKVKIFPQPGGWVYLAVPSDLVDPVRHRANRGVIAVTARVGNTAWQTSLLPMGDGTHFIALNAKVRKKEQIVVGESLSLTFKLRD